MPRPKKKIAKKSTKDRSQSFLEDAGHEETEDEDLPSNEAGRRKIKKNY